MLLLLIGTLTAMADTWYADADGDGFGDPSDTIEATGPVTGYVATGNDCDDADGDVHPGSYDDCDGVDDDCSGLADDSGACPCTVDHYQGDAYAFCTYSVNYVRATDACDTAGYHLVTLDDAVEDAWVDDAIDAISTRPWWFGYTDFSSEGTWFWLDGSTSTYTNWASGEPNNSGNEDCGELNYFSDGTWNDGRCGQSRYFVCEADAPPIWYADVDGDGYGDDDAWVYADSAPAGFVADGGDCDDAEAAIHPGATETCDGADEDCDGTIDDGLVTSTFYPDRDGDGFGDMYRPVKACSAPENHVADGSDCNDYDAATNPDAAEVCDWADNDCDGAYDEGLATTTYYYDGDLDGYGDPKFSYASCMPVSGYVEDGGDCNDRNAAINPGAAEICNGRDENCDGVADEGLATVTYYLDADGDGYGDSSTTTTACSPPSGYAEVGGDCDDKDPSVNPGAVELACNGVDDDCDGVVDDGTASTTWYRDQDGDGYGDASVSTTDCKRPSGYVADDTDCDDRDGSVHPGAPEIDGDGVDNDCDGRVDEDRDSDLDGLSDEVEAEFGTDPLNPDTDGDGLGDGKEVMETLTDPLDADTDGGGVDDGEEVLEDGTDPLDPSDDVIDTDVDTDDTDVDTDDTDVDTDDTDVDTDVDTDDTDGDTDVDTDDTDGSDTDDTDVAPGRAYGGAGCRCDAAGGSALAFGLLPLVGLVLAGRRRRAV